MSDFTTARIGDKVYSLRFGEGKIKSVEYSEWYPIEVEYMGLSSTYTINGFFDKSNSTPDLYWSKPEIIEPPPPKRMKKVTRWFNVYPVAISIHYATRQSADQYASPDRYDCIPVEFEVPEDFTC